MRPGTRISLIDGDGQWLAPIPDDIPPSEEHLIVLVENYAAFSDGEVVRLPVQPDDEIELFEWAVAVPPQIMAQRPERASPARDAWAQSIFEDFIQPQVRALQG